MPRKRPNTVKTAVRLKLMIPTAGKPGGKAILEGSCVGGNGKSKDIEPVKGLKNRLSDGGDGKLNGSGGKKSKTNVMPPSVDKRVASTKLGSPGSATPGN